MKAWVIKTKTGFAGYAGYKHKLNEAAIYSTKKRAEDDNIYGERGNEVIPVEIKLIKRR